MTIKQWAKQFVAITVSDIKNFEQTVDNNLSLHDKKRLFTEKYQDKITFSYILQVEKNIVKDLHIDHLNDGLPHDSSGYCEQVDISHIIHGCGDMHSYKHGNADGSCNYAGYELDHSGEKYGFMYPDSRGFCCGDYGCGQCFYGEGYGSNNNYADGSGGRISNRNL